MKKFIQNHTYALILASFCLVFSIIILSMNHSSSKSYMKITVSEGDSLWTIAERYSSDYSLSVHEFIKWVEQQNGITGDTIHPGDELIIPVNHSEEPSKVLADSRK